MRSVAIIGAGLGGLAAAIHLQRAGLSVTVLEQNERIGGRAGLLELGSYRFDTGPSLLNYPWVFEELFTTVGARFHDAVQLLPVDPGITFRWQDGRRLTLSSSFDCLREELARLDPGVGPRLAAWLRRAGHNYRLSFARLVQSNADNPLKWLGALRLRELWGLGLQRSLYRQLALSFRSRHICEALASYAMYLGGSPFSLPGLFEILPYGELAYGLWLPRGGIYGLIEAVGDLAREAGVNISTECRVSRIAERDGRVAGVELADGDFIPAEIVVSNCDVPQTDAALLPDGAARRHGRRRASRLRMTPAVLTFYWGLKRKLVGVDHHSIFLPADYRGSFDRLLRQQVLQEKPAFYLSIASATEPALAPPDTDTAFVLVPVPPLSRTEGVDWRAETARIRQYVLGRLAQAHIGLQAGDIAVEQVLTPRDWQQRFGLFDGSALGAAHNLTQLGPWRPCNYSRWLHGLYYVGASTTPGTGLPMVTLGGRMTAARILDHVR